MRDWERARDGESDDVTAPLRIPQLEAEIERVSAEYGIAPAQVTGGSRRRTACNAREIIARRALLLGLRASEVALRLGVTHASILRAAKRGRSAR